jgi:hypothetical protein
LLEVKFLSILDYVEAQLVKEEVGETLNYPNLGKTINLVTTEDKMQAVNSNTQMDLVKTASETATAIEPPELGEQPPAAAAEVDFPAPAVAVGFLVEIVMEQEEEAAEKNQRNP